MRLKYNFYNIPDNHNPKYKNIPILNYNFVTKKSMIWFYWSDMKNNILEHSQVGSINKVYEYKKLG